MKTISRKSFAACSLAFALPFFLAACESIRYEGKIFPALPPDTPVVIYHSERDVPRPFQVVGHGEYTAPPGMGLPEILRLFRKTARKRGVTGLLITSVRKVFSGDVRKDQAENEPPVDLWPVDDSNSADQYQFDTILYSSGSDPEIRLYRIQVRADFLLAASSAGS